MLVEFNVKNEIIRIKTCDSQTMSQCRKEYLDIRNKINELDSRLSFILAVRGGVTIINIMLNIYVIFILKSIEGTDLFIKILGVITEVSIVEIVMSAFICGSVNQRAEQIHSVLDELSANSLTEYEYNEWLMFKNICRNTRFGFTFGGFAPISKTTLIPVL